MGPTSYSLCSKPVIGAIMWISSLCAFPPPLPEAEVSLSSPGPILTATFEAPVEKSYPLILVFNFANNDERLKDKYVGSTYNQYCQGIPFEQIPEKFREGLGKPIPIKVVVTRSEDASVILDKTFESLCTTSWGPTTKNRTVGYLALPRGKFNIQVVNLQSQPEFQGVKVGVMLAGGTGK